jgi:predicted transcriptional regulator of viral defense system
MKKRTNTQRVLKLAAQRGLISTRDIEAQGLHRQVLTRLVRTNQLERVARGRYRLPDPDYELTEHHGFVLASVAAPNGVICLVSALQFHVIGTQLPRQVWIALDRRARKPVIDYPPLRVVRFSGEALRGAIGVSRWTRWSVMRASAAYPTLCALTWRRL